MLKKIKNNLWKKIEKRIREEFSADEAMLRGEYLRKVEEYGAKQKTLVDNFDELKIGYDRKIQSLVEDYNRYKKDAELERERYESILLAYKVSEENAQIQYKETVDRLDYNLKDFKDNVNREIATYQETLETRKINFTKECEVYNKEMANIDTSRKLLVEEYRAVQKKYETAALAIEEEYKRKILKLEEDYRILRAEYESKNNSLKEQIRLIEAKASPDSVWIEAFTLGVSKAWDMLKSTYASSNSEAINQLLKSTEEKIRSELNPAVENRIKKLENKKIKDAKMIQDKLKEFENKLLAAERIKDKEEIKKFQSYITTLRWCLDEKIGS